MTADDARLARNPATVALLEAAEDAIADAVELELPGELPAEIEGDDDEAEDEVDVWRPKLNRVQLRRIRNAAKRKSRLTRVGRRQRTGGVK